MTDPQPQRQDFDQLLANLLAAHRPPWTATDLARAIGCDPTTVQKWVQGKSLPRPKRLAGSIQALGLTSDAARALEEACFFSRMVGRMQRERGISPEQATWVVQPLLRTPASESSGHPSGPMGTLQWAFAEGDTQLQRLEAESALSSYLLAARLSSSPDARSENALALAGQARAHRQLNRLRQAKVSVDAAFVALDLAHLLPHEGTDFDLVKARLGLASRDPTKWQAYLHATEALGFYYHYFDLKPEKLLRAMRCFEHARRAALELEDRGAWAFNTHMLGKVLFERFSISDRPDASIAGASSVWRVPADPTKLVRGLRFLSDARGVNRQIGNIHIGADFRVAGRVEATLGHHAEADLLFQQADEFYQTVDEPLRINFMLDQARWWGRTPSRHEAVEGLLFQIEALALRTKARNMMCFGYIQSAHLYAAHGTTEYPRCRQYLAAALLLWPFSYEHRDFVRAAEFFFRLGGEADTLPQFVTSILPPFDVIAHLFMGVTGDAHIKKVQAALAKLLTSDGVPSQ